MGVWGAFVGALTNPNMPVDQTVPDVATAPDGIIFPPKVVEAGPAAVNWLASQIAAIGGQSK